MSGHAILYKCCQKKINNTNVKVNLSKHTISKTTDYFVPRIISERTNEYSGHHGNRYVNKGKPLRRKRAGQNVCNEGKTWGRREQIKWSNTFPIKIYDVISSVLSIGSIGKQTKYDVSIFLLFTMTPSNNE